LGAVKLPRELLEHSDAIDALRTIARVRWAVMEMIGKEVQQREGLPFDWCEVLILLADTPAEALRMRELARLALHSKSGVTRLVDRMERAGLVRRQPCVVDRRSVLVALTGEGRELIERVKPAVVQAMIDRFTSHITPVEARRVTATLTRVLEANGVQLEHGFEAEDAAGMPPAEANAEPAL
jgi:DNA-binding MarR family transcriptional regulator